MKDAWWVAGLPGHPRHPAAPVVLGSELCVPSRLFTATEAVGTVGLGSKCSDQHCLSSLAQVHIVNTAVGAI